MKTRDSASCACAHASQTAHTKRKPASVSASRTPTTTRPCSRPSRTPSTCQRAREPAHPSRASLPPTPTPETRLSQCSNSLAESDALRSPGYPKTPALRTLALALGTLWLLAAPATAIPELSLPFNLESTLTRSRFASLAGGGVRTRDIHVFLVKNISENTPLGTVLDIFRAHDRDQPGFNYTFRISRETDPKRQFTIDQNGELKVAAPLDREDIPEYKLLIEACDAVGNSGQQMVAVYLIDENDNGPIPYTVPDPCIFMENLPPEAQKPCEIRAIDRDTAEFGPPFKMELDAGRWQYGSYLNVTFNPNGDGGNGSMTVRPLVQLDREAAYPGKVLEIPLSLWDKAGKMNKHSVFIIVGDENDNPMSDGKTSIQVNSYLGKLARTSIGRVYVEDLDDWDLGDKTFVWKSAPRGFEISTSGEIVMEAEMPAGRYEMVAAVHDHARNEDAKGEVTVTVVDIPQTAFDNQGSLQVLLSPDTSVASPADFVRINENGFSLADVFRQEMVTFLGGAVDIDIFSIQPSTATLQTADIPVLNVRFSAHGSPYRTPALLNGLISANRDRLESKLGAVVVGVGIDMCKFTRCDNGCQTINSADHAGIVVSANSTVFVGVNSTSRDSCECPIWRAPDACSSGVCHNDGVCHNLYPGFFCECRNDALKGPRCQGTTRSFGGDGFAWYKPVPACTSLNISLNFMTQNPEGVLLYAGPMRSSASAFQLEYEDYILLQLKAGRLQLDLVMNGKDASQLSLAASQRLDDGKWHTVAIRQEGRSIEMVLDECRFLAANCGDESQCRATLRTSDDDERLNVVAPLQIGGLAPLSGQQYPSAVQSSTGLTGCIRNVIINDELYDLGTPAYEKKTERGCSLWGTACESNSVDSLTFCTHGDCYADVKGAPKCVCDPGWSGDRCEVSIEWIQFSPGGSIDYALNVDFDEHTSDIELLFIPGRTTGSSELMYTSNGLQSYASAYIDGQSPAGKFDIWPVNGANGGEALTSLRLPQLQMKENNTYWMQLRRNPARAQLAIDGNYFTAKSLDPCTQPFNLAVKQLLLGSQPQSPRGFAGCIGTFRFDQKALPLRVTPFSGGSNSAQSSASQAEGGASYSAQLFSIDASQGVTNGCSLRITCADLRGDYCGGSFVCVDFWKGPMCTCPEGANAVLGEDGQVVGCGETLAVAKLGISNSAILIVSLAIILLLALLLIMFVSTMRRRPAPFESVRPDDLNRDTLRPYAVEGGGEADNDNYSIANLRKPVMPLETGGGLPGLAPPIYPAGGGGRVGGAPDDRLAGRIKDLDADQDTAPFDELRIYDDERDNVSMVTLESVDSVGTGGGRQPPR